MGCGEERGEDEEDVKKGSEISIFQVWQKLHTWPITDGDLWPGAFEPGTFPSSLTHFSHLDFLFILLSHLFLILFYYWCICKLHKATVLLPVSILKHYYCFCRTWNMEILGGSQYQLCFRLAEHLHPDLSLLPIKWRQYHQSVAQIYEGVCMRVPFSFLINSLHFFHYPCVPDPALCSGTQPGNLSEYLLDSD